MSRRPECSRLCRLIHDSLNPYFDSLPSTLTKDTEKSLLITLSEVFRKIKEWTQEYEFESDSENEGDWNEFVHLMCLSLKFAIHSTFSTSSEPIATKTKDLASNLSIPVTRLKFHVKRANLLTVASITQFLRNVLKLLRQDLSDQRFKVYLDVIGTTISDISWNLVNKACIAQSDDFKGGLSGGVLLHAKSAQLKSLTIFRANLLQFFCSLVDSNNFEPGVDSVNNQLIISAVSNIIPIFLDWCLQEPECSPYILISHYFKHKILMLMIRLSTQNHSDCEVLCSKLLLMQQYFQDLLMQPLSSLESDHDDCLEGSPFWLHAVNSKRESVSPYHLQRLAVFLFLSCSFSLISKEKTSVKCVCGDPSFCLAVDLNANSNCCRRKRGMLELHRWLRGQLPADILEDGDMYSARCVSFAISFLRLYIREDDFLFKMLLQLFYVPGYSDRCIVEEEAFLTAKDNMAFIVTDVFNPINMFHLLFSEIHYDHQVLLDYLISKDSGASCAEYLLRCLRMICNSWNIFMELSKSAEALSRGDRKRRKLSADCLENEVLPSILSVRNIEMKWKQDHAYARHNEKTQRLSFEDAKYCLFSLKTSIESLSRKDLFPYNPQVLLRRLTRFQELCLTT